MLMALQQHSGKEAEGIVCTLRYLNDFRDCLD